MRQPLARASEWPAGRRLTRENRPDQTVPLLHVFGMVNVTSHRILRCEHDIAAYDTTLEILCRLRCHIHTGGAASMNSEHAGEWHHGIDTAPHLHLIDLGSVEAGNRCRIVGVDDVRGYACGNLIRYQLRQEPTSSILI